MAAGVPGGASGHRQAARALRAGHSRSRTVRTAGPYSDTFDERHGNAAVTPYRGNDPRPSDNVGLHSRDHGASGVPLGSYFHGVRPGGSRRWRIRSVRRFGDDSGADSMFTMQVDRHGRRRIRSARPSTEPDLSSRRTGPPRRRAYVTRTIRQRVHQVAFRERVIRAYQERCALCSLRHQELLDAAHIIPDRDPEGEPLVSNGVALCKLHHAAFDRFFFAIRPDYSIEVRRSILDERRDGPMLVVGLQRIHGQQILLPPPSVDRAGPSAASSVGTGSSCRPG